MGALRALRFQTGVFPRQKTTPPAPPLTLFISLALKLVIKLLFLK